MNQRKSSGPLTGTYVAAIVVVFALVVAAVWWFAIRDSDDGDTNTPTGTVEQTFKLDGIPFTFKYPGTFATPAPPTGILWVGSATPVDLLDLRRIANAEYSPEKLDREMTALVKKQPGTTISASTTTTIASLPALQLTIANASSGSPLVSQLYFFSFAGATWQFECQSQDSGRAAIDAACARALKTFTTS